MSDVPPRIMNPAQPAEIDPPLWALGSWARAHGLGNDYLVFEGAPDPGGLESPPPSTWSVVRRSVARVCHRTRGVGSDGIVVSLPGGDGSRRSPFPLRMFNPDGSEFERSGNGLRILAAWLVRRERVSMAEPFWVTSGGDLISMTVHGEPSPGLFDVSVSMGRARLGAQAVGLRGSGRDGSGRGQVETLVHPDGDEVDFVPVSVGNPHSVVFPDDSNRSDPLAALDRLGPFLAEHPDFASGTNVQLARVAGPHRLHIEIWERGVGRTLASGSSSCASAVAAVHSGRMPPGTLTVVMEGGELTVTVSPELDVLLRGPVQEVADGGLAPGFVRYVREQ